MRTWQYLIVALLVLSGTASAGSYQITYQGQLEGLEAYWCHHIDPIVSEIGQLDGFVYSDSANRRLIIDKLVWDSVLVLDLNLGVTSSVNYVSADSLVIYALSDPWLYRIVEQGHDVQVDSTWTIWVYCGHWTDVASSWMGFGTTSNGCTGLLVERELICNYLDMTIGRGQSSRSVIFESKLDLTSPVRYDSVSSIRFGNLAHGSELEQATFHNRWSWYHYNDGPPNDPPDYSWHKTRIIGPGINRYSESGIGYALFVDDFIPDNEYEELIYYGASADLMLLHNSNPHWHIACYSFASGAPQEVWYTDTSYVTPEYVYKPGGFLASKRGSRWIMALDYQTGEVIDSTELDRDLISTKFFETGLQTPVLNLLGRSDDTVFVYQFQIPTEVPEEPEDLIPSEYSLFQNYPNPFNAGTTIEFSLRTDSFTELVIYNVKGEKVTTLLNRPLSSGDYCIEWDGSDRRGKKVSSGVYFYQLTADNSPRTQKMLMLK